MTTAIPDWIDPRPWLNESTALPADPDSAATREFSRHLGRAAPRELEQMAQRAQAMTRRHFGKTISLYVPLYMSNYCPNGCAYCGFASDREQTRHRLEEPELIEEMRALKGMGFEEILLLTGARTPQADFAYLCRGVSLAAEHFHRVTVESFAMQTDEYRALVEAGCTGITIYQETYNPELYAELHRWGPKRDYCFRLEAPARAFAAGMRTVGVGALLGIGDPLFDAVALFRHARHLQKNFWRGGVSVSFPRIRNEGGGYRPPCPVDDRLLAQMIFAFRLCLPDVPLVLSTREAAEFRNGIAGIGISKMSAASRTTVGGYGAVGAPTEGQFEVEDRRDVKTFCKALRKKGLEPVFKNWEAAFRG